MFHKTFAFARLSHTCAAALLALFAIPGFVIAQTSGEISGSITDPTEAVVPEADIAVINQETGIERHTKSNGEGAYVVSLLQPGSYSLTVQKEGFSPATRSGVVMHVADRIRLDFQLSPGSVTEEVVVVADAPLIQTTAATQQQVVDNQKMVQLPLNGRDYNQLALISAGAIQTSGNARFQSFSGSGMRAGENNFVLDGLDNNNMQNSAQSRQAEAVKPSVDAIQEFKVMTNSFSAEYGRGAGGVVSVSIKSGTNELHGTAYEFLRNEKLDAKNFFDLPSAPRPPFKRNQYGFSVGGPIRKSKTFIFGDYESTRIRESRTVNNTIPTQAQTSGDFSQILSLLYDPLTYEAATRARQPFANNIIPSSRLDPVGAAVAALYPAPNKAGLTQNFLFNPPIIQDQDTWDVRVDHKVGPMDDVFVRYSWQRNDSPAAPELPAPAFGATGNGANFENDGRNWVVGYNHVFGPSLLLSMRGGYNSIVNRQSSPVDHNVNQELGLRGVDQETPGMARFGLTGFTGVGVSTSIPNSPASDTAQYAVDLTWLTSAHNVKFGANLSWVHRSLLNPREAHGSFNFNGTFTRDSVTLGQGSSVADLLLGYPQSAQVSDIVLGEQRSPYYDLYVQDDWRVSPRLTLNLGLRYELHLPWVDDNNAMANVYLDDAREPQFLLAQDGGSRFDRALVGTDKNNFGPRLGFAYQANDKTVIRGGYGIYYSNVRWQQVLFFSPPFHTSVTLTTDPTQPSLSLQQGLPADAVQLSAAENVTLRHQQLDGLLPYAQQMSFSIQTQLPGDSMLEVGYYGNQVRKQVRGTELNAPAPGAGNVNDRRPIQSVLIPDYGMVDSGSINSVERSANASFNSFQAKFEKRLSGGLSLLTSYIWSKTIADARGDAADGGGVLNPQDPLNLRAERALADEHIPHRFVSSYVYDLPFGRGRSMLTDAHPVVNAIFGGWTTAGIVTLAGGRYTGMTVQGNPSNTGVNADRPNVVGDPILSSSERTLERWFDTSAFERNPLYTYGNAGKNVISGPGMVNFDLALYKEFAFSEGTKKFQFRWEAFNAFNTPQFDAPNTQFGNGNFGRISAAGRPRNMQLGLKFIF